MSSSSQKGSVSRVSFFWISSEHSETVLLYVSFKDDLSSSVVFFEFYEPLKINEFLLLWHFGSKSVYLVFSGVQYREIIGTVYPSILMALYDSLLVEIRCSSGRKVPMTELMSVTSSRIFAEKCYCFSFSKASSEVYISTSNSI